ncbi:MAG: hypothetical protein C4516_09430 [Oxalobacter sp.]|nr:MAG: hypothetical protein C4516_09430 [Oxalobacter sp.]
MLGAIFPVVEIESFNDLLPYLSGKVFHVTLASNWDDITAVGKLLVNTSDRLSPFGNTVNGYFRFKGCVSFFDYRAYGSAEWEDHSYKCLPTLPLEAQSHILVLFLSQSEHHKLRSWEGWKQDQLWSYRVVPYVECGYPGSVELSAIQEVLHVRKKSNLTA